MTSSVTTKLQLEELMARPERFVDQNAHEIELNWRD
jgi:hypothetical protein